MNLDGDTLDELGFASPWADLHRSMSERAMWRPTTRTPKLSPSDVEALLASSESHAVVARRLGVTYQAVAWRRTRAALFGERVVESRGSRKLTDAQVREVLASSESHAALARRFGVGMTAVAYHRAKARGKDYAREARVRRRNAS